LYLILQPTFSIDIDFTQKCFRRKKMNNNKILNKIKNVAIEVRQITLKLHKESQGRVLMTTTGINNFE